MSIERRQQKILKKFSHINFEVCRVAHRYILSWICFATVTCNTPIGWITVAKGIYTRASSCKTKKNYFKIFDSRLDIEKIKKQSIKKKPYHYIHLDRHYPPFHKHHPRIHKSIDIPANLMEFGLHHR